MQFAADLHLHSRHSSAVSPAMTLEAIALWARRKGIDLIGSADCLQPVWLANLEEKLIETAPGFFALVPERDAEIQRELPTRLQTPLRFVLSTEVHCAPAGTPDLGGVHHLIYFRSFASARKMQQRLARFGDLTEGRPRLKLNSRELFEIVAAQGDGCRFALAHVFNPFFSTFGTLSGGRFLADTFGGFASQVKLAETGLTSTPWMCRRLSTLNSCALFSSSDAHSLENIGRECTLIECEGDYEALFDALEGRGPGRILRTVKFPIERTRYYRNRCLACQKSFDGGRCPVCGSNLVMGARDRLEIVADRRDPVFPDQAPPFRMLLPLRDVLAAHVGSGHDSKGVSNHYFRLLEAVGSERFILTEATEGILAGAATRALAREIVAQRETAPGRLVEKVVTAEGSQLSFFEVEAGPGLGAMERMTSADDFASE